MNISAIPIPTPMEVYADAKIRNSKIAVVEGIDDIAIYDKIISDNNLNIEVKAIDNVQILDDNHNRITGCEGIILMFEKVSNSIASEESKRYLLGIIDRDYRDFKNENPNNELIFVLDRYSIENYFLNINTFKACLSHYTRLSENDLNQNWVIKEFDSIKNNLLEKLFLLCIESLKKQLTPNYESSIHLDLDSPDRYLRDAEIKQEISRKTKMLLDYAESLSLHKNIETLIHICKGKWLIAVYAELIKEFINKNKLCTEYQEDEIEKCQYCKVGNTQNCLHKKKINCNLGEVKVMLKKPELIDISQKLLTRLQNLALS